jgi:uncharacterized protein (TIGR02145 family)
MINKRFILNTILLLGFGLTVMQAQQSNLKTHVDATVTDIDGNIYHTITIGTQTWMVENLKTTNYSNGDLIGTTSPDTLNISNESTPKYQWVYNNDKNNLATYGRLYTWYAIADSRNVCPKGWHVTTNNEWTTLANFLGGDSVAGDKLKEIGTTHWISPNSDATNEYGFTAVPSGSRWPKSNVNKIYAQMGEYTHFWTATESVKDTSCAWRRRISQGHNLHRGWAQKKIGWPVRCIKD